MKINKCTPVETETIKIVQRAYWVNEETDRKLGILVSILKFSGIKCSKSSVVNDAINLFFLKYQDYMKSGVLDADLINSKFAEEELINVKKCIGFFLVRHK